MRLSEEEKKKFANGVKTDGKIDDSDLRTDHDDDILSAKYPGVEGESEKKDDKK